MNRSEAYKLLISELEKFRSLGLHSATELLNDSSEIFKQSSSGVTYTLTIEISGASLKGSIHDNNTSRFELLEEQMEF